MTWSPSTLRAKAMRSARQKKNTGRTIIDLGTATRLTRERRELPPNVRTWPLRVYLVRAEQSANDPTERPEHQTPQDDDHGAQLRVRGVHPAARLTRD